jgi:hypothetical protein
MKLITFIQMEYYIIQINFDFLVSMHIIMRFGVNIIYLYIENNLQYYFQLFFQLDYINIYFTKNKRFY